MFVPQQAHGAALAGRLVVTTAGGHVTYEAYSQM